MMREHSAHLSSLPVGFRTWLWRYTCLLLLILMLSPRQAIFSNRKERRLLNAGFEAGKFESLHTNCRFPNCVIMECLIPQDFHIQETHSHQVIHLAWQSPARGTQRNKHMPIHNTDTKIRKCDKEHRTLNPLIALSIWGCKRGKCILQLGKTKGLYIHEYYYRPKTHVIMDMQGSHWSQSR